MRKSDSRRVKLLATHDLINMQAWTAFFVCRCDGSISWSGDDDANAKGRGTDILQHMVAKCSPEVRNHIRYHGTT